MRARTWVAATTLSVALTATACTPGSNNDTSNDPSPKDVTTDSSAITDLGDVELTVWDQETRPSMSKHIDSLNAAFEEKYPNVTITRDSRSFDDLRRTLRLAISGGEAPDVVQANNGRSDMGQFVKAGLLENLDGYAAAYGWDDRYPASIRALASYTEDGSTFGQGSLWGVPITGEMVGLWYNKAKLDELGIEVPTATADFESALAKAKSDGEVPIQFGNLDGWPGIHDFGFVHNQFVAGDQVRDLAFGVEGGDWNDEANTEAATTFATWADSGYFTPDFNAVGYDPAWKSFAQGTGVFLVAGTWLLDEDLDETLGDDLGFTLPPVGETDEQLVTGGTGLPFSITSASEHPEVGAAYLDFITTEEAMQGVADGGGFPVIGTDQIQADGVQGEVFDAWTKAQDEDAVVPYLDYATPDFYDLLVSEVQKLGAGSTDPAGFTGALQDDYSSFVADNSAN